jgi:hypothetical protein
MELEYKLDENDYLQHQLYTATKTERIKKQRKKSWILVSSVFFLIAFLDIRKEDKFQLYSFTIIGIISVIFYPIYLRNHYKKHYAKFIKETYKNKFGETIVVDFFEDKILIKNSSAESKVEYSAFEEFNEIGEYIFLKLKGGESFVIPKLKIDNLVELKIELKKIAEKNIIKQNTELDWKWK